MELPCDSANLVNILGKWAGLALLSGSSKTAPRILIFSIAMVANYLFDVKNIDIWVPAFFKHNNSFIATVNVYVFMLIKLRGQMHFDGRE